MSWMNHLISRNFPSGWLSVDSCVPVCQCVWEAPRRRSGDWQSMRACATDGMTQGARIRIQRFRSSLATFMVRSATTEHQTVVIFLLCYLCKADWARVLILGTVCAGRQRRNGDRGHRWKSQKFAWRRIQTNTSFSAETVGCITHTRTQWHWHAHLHRFTYPYRTQLLCGSGNEYFPLILDIFFFWFLFRGKIGSKLVPTPTQIFVTWIFIKNDKNRFSPNAHSHWRFSLE